MRDGYIFWEQSLRVVGPGAPVAVATRLQALLSTTRFSLGERLVGTVDGARVRVWRKTPIAGNSDVVEFDGVIRPDGRGVAIDGTVRYKSASRIQFVGFLAIGLLLTAAGAMQLFTATDASGDLAAFGLFISALALAWIYSCHRMRIRQIEFIRTKLAEALAA